MYKNNNFNELILLMILAPSYFQCIALKISMVMTSSSMRLIELSQEWISCQNQPPALMSLTTLHHLEPKNQHR